MVVCGVDCMIRESIVDLPLYPDTPVTVFFFSSRRRHTRCALVTGVQTCALPICSDSQWGATVFLPFRMASYNPSLINGCPGHWKTPLGSPVTTSYADRKSVV